MELTLLLSKVFGLFLIIAGAALLLRRHYFVPVVGAFVEQRLTRAVVSMAELLAALFLVVTHNKWSPLPAAIISTFGWMAVGGSYRLPAASRRNPGAVYQSIQ